MAVLAPRETTPAYPATDAPIPALEASTAFKERMWAFVPICGSLLIVSTLFWGPFLAPAVLGAGIIAFFGYWLIRSYAVAVACIVGLRRIARWKARDWEAEYIAHSLRTGDDRPWDWARHMVIIPNYKETEAGLARTIDSLAAQSNTNQVVVVLAMEAREAGAHEKAERLVARYRGTFANMFATFHPAGLPGETPGKGSNEAWAAREAYEWLIVRDGENLDRYTITSCDADAVFHPRHFAALNYQFLTVPDPYRTFWQPTIFNSNNIWDIPAPQRMLDGLSGINRLSNLVMPGSVRFPTSCYSLSWRMLHEVDYWDEEVIPEDWHVYLKSCFTLGDRVHVDPIYLPLGNDCVLTDGYLKTMRAHYAQSVRHAWGCTDIPYAMRAATSRRSPLGIRRRILLAGAVTKVHTLWMAQWYLITLGSHLPVFLNDKTSANMPSWWLARDIHLPGPNWHLGEMLRGDFSDPVGGILFLTIANTLIYFCLFPLIAMIIIEFVTRGPRPSYIPLRNAIGGFLMWPAMALITFSFASLPALHAQLKFASGRGLIYRVAEKGNRQGALAVSTAHQESVAEPVGAIGGGS